MLPSSSLLTLIIIITTSKHAMTFPLCLHSRRKGGGGRGYEGKDDVRRKEKKENKIREIRKIVQEI